MLERIPAWSTTGVGSLPLADPVEAVAHVLGAYDVPFCPQLPAAEGDMVTEWLGSDPARCGWSPARDRERPVTWDALLSALAASPPAHGAVKLQVTGPLTLACALERERGAAPSRAGTLALAREVAVWLGATASAQSRLLAERGLSAIVVVDEPVLAAFGTGGAERAWEPLRAVAPAWGLHLCCAVPWELVRRARPDLLSFDLAVQALDRRSAEVLDELLEAGCTVAWGVLAGHRREGAAAARRRLDAALARLSAPTDRSLLTASCGTGRLSPAREGEVAAALARVARERAEPTPTR